jgi:hypothetical protein
MEGASIDLVSTLEYFNAIKEITDEKKHAAMIEASHYFIIHPDSIQHLVKGEITSKRIASAYYNVSMPNRLTINFLKNSYPHATPLQLFDTYTAAMEWIQTFKSHF